MDSVNAAEDCDWTRGSTPGLGKAIAHFNAAGASLPTRSTLDAATSYLELEAEIGG